MMRGWFGRSPQSGTDPSLSPGYGCGAAGAGYGRGMMGRW